MHTKTHRFGSFRTMMALCLLLSLLSGSRAHATHFRYGNIQWMQRRDVGQNTAEITLLAAFRRDGYPGTASDGHPKTGDVILETIGNTGLNFGDGRATGTLFFLVLSYDPSANWVYCRALADPSNVGKPIVHTYSGPGPWTVNIDTCCRISNSVNAGNQNYRVESSINFGIVSNQLVNSSPVSQLPAIINLQQGGIRQFQVPAADPQGQILLYRLALPSEDGGMSQPAGLSISPTGTVTWNTTGLRVGLYSCQVVVTATDVATGAFRTKVGVDFLLNLVSGAVTGNAPVFFGTPNGTTFDTAAGKQITYNVSTRGDLGDVIQLNAIGLPPGATLIPGLPTSGNPVSSTFSWTPTAAQVGAYILTFVATDLTSTLQTQVTYVINVKLDSDGDGLPDDWELHGYTINGHFVDLPAMGADPNHKDIFVYTDYMVQAGPGGHTHKPIQAALDTIVQSFADAPVANPDGVTGINLHVVLGSALAHTNAIGSFDGLGNYDWTAYDAIKSANFPSQYAPAFHYCLFGHNYATTTSSGIARGIPANDFLVSLGSFNNSVGTQLQQAGTFMHEMGHTLGLRHGGGDNINYKPNYLSIMSYAWQLGGLRRNGANGLFDYSRFNLPALNENALLEGNGLIGGVPIAGFTNYGATWWNASGQQTTDNVNAIDWNSNGAINPAAIPLDINNNGTREVLNSYDDWANINYRGGLIGTGLNLPLPQLTPANEDSLPNLAAVKPFAPASFSARAATKAVRLAWNLIDPLGENTYNIYRAVGNGSFQLLGNIASPLYSDTNLTSGVKYHYYVTTVSPLGAESNPTVTLIATPH